MPSAYSGRASFNKTYTSHVALTSSSHELELALHAVLPVQHTLAICVRLQKIITYRKVTIVCASFTYTDYARQMRTHKIVSHYVSPA